jgi:HAD superfamily hydrolase (TIGR01549 family)
MAALLLLDLDNTLADRETAFMAWACERADEWAPGDADALAYLIDHDDDGIRPRREFFAAVREHFGLHRAADELIVDYRRKVRRALPAVTGTVLDRLRALRSDGWKLAVVTNGEADVQAATVDQLGLRPFLDACCISGELGFRKPDPRIFEHAARRCGATLAGACMVGDGEVDVIGARGAGIPSVWLHRGRTWTRTDVEPDCIAGSLVAALSPAMLGACTAGWTVRP